MQAMDDMALLREYASRDSEAAFAELVSRRVGFVHAAALRQVRDPQMAEEVTQAVFIILAQKAGKISDRTNLTGWLFKTTRFAALAQVRAAAKRSIRHTSIEQEFQMQTESQQIAPDVLWEKMSPMLDEALTTLGEKDRQAVLLRYFENKNLAEVGNKLGAGEDTARKRVSRALEKLRKFFSKRGVVSTTAIIAGAMSANSVQAAPALLAKSVTAVAITKGAAVSASTILFIKGALNLMAWAKAKTAVLVGVATLLAVGTATLIVLERSSSGIEYKGTFTQIFPMAQDGPKTNILHFSLLSKPPYWELSLTTTGINHKVFSSPQQTFEVDIWTNPSDGPLNTATLNIYPGARPLNDPFAEHIWLALLSGKTFVEQELPLHDPGLGMAEPSVITEAIGTERDGSPRQMRWFNEYPKGRSIRFEGEFKWLTNTNTLAGLNIPKTSQMAMYVVDTNGMRELLRSSEMVVESVASSTVRPAQIPRISGRNVVYDFRLGDFSTNWWVKNLEKYDVRDGKGLENLRSSR